MEIDTYPKQYGPLIKIGTAKGIPKRKKYQQFFELYNGKIFFETIILEMYDSFTFRDYLSKKYTNPINNI